MILFIQYAASFSFDPAFIDTSVRIAREVIARLGLLHGRGLGYWDGGAGIKDIAYRI